MRVAIFLAASAAIAQLSWRSLKDWRSHGFYRFFAFELLAALILLNIPAWFRDPLGSPTGVMVPRCCLDRTSH